jgi:hypothetical protein
VTRIVKNSGASVRDRLLLDTQRKRGDFQLALRRYMIERFLYRLGRSEYRERFVLKGAMLFRPNVIVTDNEVAEWKSVSEIPYQQITQSELGGQIGTTAFKEAGVTVLSVPSTCAPSATISVWFIVTRA